MKKFLNFTNSTEFDRISNPCLNLDFYRPVLCSVSGGQDSIGTLFTTIHLFSFAHAKTKKSTQNTKYQKHLLKVVYCHHFWQIKNFFLLFFLFQINFIFHSPYVAIFSTKKFLNENYSRNWRKRSFYRILEVEKILNISIGQTKTDSIEKNVNNILRGTTLTSITNSISFNYRNSLVPFFSSLILKSYFFEKKYQHRKKIYFDFKNKFSLKKYSPFLNSRNFYFKTDFFTNYSLMSLKNKTLEQKFRNEFTKPIFYFFLLSLN